MGSDEIAIIDYLKQFPKSFTNASEICKKAAGRRRFARDPEWARPALRRLEAEGHLVTDSFGHYKLSAALFLKHTQHARETSRADRAQQAVIDHVIKMGAEDDEKPFSLLIRQALSADYSKETGLEETGGNPP